MEKIGPGDGSLTYTTWVQRRFGMSEWKRIAMYLTLVSAFANFISATCPMLEGNRAFDRDGSPLWNHFSLASGGNGITHFRRPQCIRCR